MRAHYCNVLSLTFSPGDKVIAACILCLFGELLDVTGTILVTFLLFLYLLVVLVFFFLNELKYSHLTEVVLASHANFPIKP